jgi:hypothetical protein
MGIFRFYFGEDKEQIESLQLWKDDVSIKGLIMISHTIAKIGYNFRWIWIYW